MHGKPEEKVRDDDDDKIKLKKRRKKSYPHHYFTRHVSESWNDEYVDTVVKFNYNIKAARVFLYCKFLYKLLRGYHIFIFIKQIKL